MRTQVAIVGAGPSGLLLGQLLDRAGIEAVIIERQSAAHVLSRIRAGILEQTTVDTLHAAGVGERLRRESIVHDGINIVYDNQHHHIDVRKLTGAVVTAYGQTELTRDLMDARAASGVPTHYEVQDVRLEGLTSATPLVHFNQQGEPRRIECDYVAGCDGFHGVSRRSIPAGELREFERAYPFGWIGVLADVPPVSPHAVTYAHHARGFALCSMRSLSRSRYYVQCSSSDRVENWSDDRFWDELSRRLDTKTAGELITGPSIEKSIAPLRSYVAEPMRWGRLFLAGDAAHIVPPTGAKGLNLAVSDVRLLAAALVEHYRERSDAGIESYSSRALSRVWKVERFAWWATALLHTFPDTDDFGRRMQEAELATLTQLESASRGFAEHYAGLAF